MDHQSAFFRRLQQRYPSRQAMVTAVAGMLHLSKDAIYRRLRGDTVLSTNEMLELCTRHDLGPLPGSTGIPFKYNRASKEIRQPADYLEQLEGHLNALEGMAVKKLYLANSGLPFFHEMLTPRLFAFKLYIYGITCWDFAGWRKLKFSMSLIDERVLDQAHAIGRYAYRIPGKELLTMGMLQGILDQIEFMEMSGRMAAPDEWRLLLDDLDAMVVHLHEMARHGKKFLPGTNPADSTTHFEPAHNELANNDNVVLVQSDTHSLLFVALVTPNFLRTEDEMVCQLTQNWFENIIGLSTSLGPSGGRYRDWYFRRLQEQIAGVRKRLGEGWK